MTGNPSFSAGNGNFDGRTDWGDSVLETTPDASRLLQSYTPRNQAYLSAADLDLGSGSVGIVPVLGLWRLGIQAGKDGMVRPLNLANLNGTGRAGTRLGGEIVHSGISGGVYSQPAIVRTRIGAIALVASSNETVAFRIRIVRGRLEPDRRRRVRRRVRPGRRRHFRLRRRDRAVSRAHPDEAGALGTSDRGRGRPDPAGRQRIRPGFASVPGHLTLDPP